MFFRPKTASAQGISDGGDHANLLDVGRVLVAVVNLELSLTGRLNLA